MITVEQAREEAFARREHIWHLKHKWLKMSKRQRLRMWNSWRTCRDNWFRDCDDDVIVFDSTFSNWPKGIASWARRRWGKSRVGREFQLGWHRNAAQRRSDQRKANSPRIQQVVNVGEQDQDIPF